MSDWIDRLRRVELESRKEQTIRDRVRLRNADIGAAKAPDFWDKLRSYARSICGDLAKLKRNQPQNECTMVEVPDKNWFRISNHVCPATTVEVELNADASVLWVLHGQEGLSQDERARRRISVEIEVDANESLRFSLDRRAFTSPMEFAEYLVQRVSGLPELDPRDIGDILHE